MAVSSLVFAAEGLGGPLWLTDLSIDPQTGQSLSITTAGQWLRLIVPDGIAGQVALAVSVPLDGQLHEVHYDVYSQVYDSSGNFSGTLIGTDQHYVVGVPGPLQPSLYLRCR